MVGGNKWGRTINLEFVSETNLCTILKKADGPAQFSKLNIPIWSDLSKIVTALILWGMKRRSDNRTKYYCWSQNNQLKEISFINIDLKSTLGVAIKVHHYPPDWPKLSQHLIGIFFTNTWPIQNHWALFVKPNHRENGRGRRYFPNFEPVLPNEQLKSSNSVSEWACGHFPALLGQNQRENTLSVGCVTTGTTVGHLKFGKRLRKNSPRPNPKAILRDSRWRGGCRYQCEVPVQISAGCHFSCFCARDFLRGVQILIPFLLPLTQDFRFGLFSAAKSPIGNESQFDVGEPKSLKTSHFCRFFRKIGSCFGNSTQLSPHQPQLSNINASTRQHVNRLITRQHINASTHHINVTLQHVIHQHDCQHVNTSTCQHVNMSTRQHVNTVIKVSTRLHSHQNVSTSTYRHVNIWLAKKKVNFHTCRFFGCLRVAWNRRIWDYSDCGFGLFVGFRLIFDEFSRGILTFLSNGQIEELFF
jgi:hypothetical protein